jgi:hypothetical protein
MDALAGINLRLPVQGEMIGVLGDQDMRDQSLGRDAAFDNARRLRRLHDHALAGAAAITGTARHDNAEGSRHDIEPLCDILADDMESAAAASADRILDINNLLDPFELHRQRAPVGLARAALTGSPRNRIQTGIHTRQRGIEFFERELELIVIELFRSHPETVALEAVMIAVSRPISASASTPATVSATTCSFKSRPSSCCARTIARSVAGSSGRSVASSIDAIESGSELPVNPNRNAASTGQLRRLRASSGMDAAPVQTLQKSAELSRGQTHHAIMDHRPVEAAFLEPLGHQAKPRAVPPDQFYPIRLLRSEHIDYAGEGIGTERRLHQRRQRIRPLPEIHRPCGDQDMRARAGTDHRVIFSASITAAITCVSAPREIFTDTPSISSSTAGAVPCARRLRRRLIDEGTVSATATGAGSTTAGTNDGGVVASAAYRNSRRQVNSCDGLMP